MGGGVTVDVDLSHFTPVEIAYSVFVFSRDIPVSVTCYFA